MKKTLIALAVLGAFGAAQAADVTIYGQLNPSYDYVSAKAVNGTKTKIFNMNDNSSRLGFKGSEDLGGGLKAIFQLESYYNMVDEGSFKNGDGARDSWVGLAGSFGSITFGSHDNAVKKMFASYDPFGDTINDYNGILSNGINSRNSKSAYYTSPKMMGVSVQASYALDTMRVDTDNSTQQAKYAFGAEYANGPLKVTAAYNSMQNTSTAGQDRSGFRLGAAYTLPTKTGLSVVYDKESGVNAKKDRNAYMLGVAQPMGNIDLLATAIYADETASGANDGATALNLGVKYNFSKRTNVMAMYALLNNDTNGAYEMDAGYDQAGKGGDYNAFSVRLQHKF